MTQQRRLEQILIVRLAALGDIARATSIVGRARRECPEARLTWVVDISAASLLRLVPGIDRIVSVNAERLLTGDPLERVRECVRLWWLLGGTTFDLALLAHPDPRYRILMAGIRTRRVRTLPAPTRDKTTFVGDEFAALLDDRSLAPNEFPVADLRDAVADVPLPPDVRLTDRPTALLVPGGARNLLRDDPLRRWPVTSYATLADELLSSGYDVALLGADSDRWALPAFEGLAVRDFTGKLDLPQTLKLMAQPRIVVVTHDTGPLHLAHLVRAPIVALFGPTVPSRVVGTAENITALWGGAHLACRPCYDGKNYAPCTRNLCLEDISVAQVLIALEDAFSATVPPRVAAGS